MFCSHFSNMATFPIIWGKCYKHIRNNFKWCKRNCFSHLWYVCKHSLYTDPLGTTLSDDNTLKSETKNIYYHNPPRYINRPAPFNVFFWCWHTPETWQRYQNWPWRHMFQTIIVVIHLSFQWLTLPKTNSLHLKMMVLNRNLLFSGSIFGCYVSFQGG